MSKELKIDDFESVPDKDCVKGCSECYFNDFGCGVYSNEIGAKLERLHGDCSEFPEHYYKLKNAENGSN